MPNAGLQLRRAITVQAEGKKLLENHAIAPSAARHCWIAPGKKSLGLRPSIATYIETRKVPTPVSKFKERNMRDKVSIYVPSNVSSRRSNTTGRRFLFVSLPPPGRHRNRSFGERSVKSPPSIVNRIVPILESLLAKILVLVSYVVTQTVMERGNHHLFEPSAVASLNSRAQSFEEWCPCPIRNSALLEQGLSQLRCPSGDRRRKQDRQEHNEDSHAFHL